MPHVICHTAKASTLGLGLTTHLVAALHDTSVGMIEKHYAAYVVDAMGDLVAKAVLELPI